MQERPTDHELDFTESEHQNAATKTCSINTFKDNDHLPFYDAVCDSRKSTVYSITYWKAGIHHVCIVEESLESCLSACNNLREKSHRQQNKQASTLVYHYS